MHAAYVVCMNVSYLERQLRAGKSPESLGAKIIGNGAQRTAYRIDNLVIKSNSGGWRTGLKRPPKEIAQYGAIPCRQYKAGKWIIQQFVTPLCDVKTRQWNFPVDHSARIAWKVLDTANLGDIHEYNCGVNNDGKLVVFDW